MHIKRVLRRSCTGFILAELVAILALLALMAVLTAPTFQRWLLRDRIDQAARSLLTTFSYARGEALRLGSKINVCRADDTAHCAKTTWRCGSGTHARADNWACGWLVMIDAESAADAAYDGVPDPVTGGSRVLRRYSASTGLSIVSPAAALPFTPPAGQVVGSFRSFEIAPAAAAWAASQAPLMRCIRLAAGGRSRISDGACGSAS